MTDTYEPVDPTVRSVDRRRPTGRSSVIAAVAVVAVVVVALVVAASTPSPSVPLTAGASAAPAASAASSAPAGSGERKEAARASKIGGEIRITAISGSRLSLETVDGWTRTITVGPDTRITKAGEAIALGDLAVGDQIRFTQQRADDGSFTIVAVRVPTAKARGEVTANTASTLTLQGRRGQTQAIRLTPETVFRLGSQPGTRADAKVGMDVVVHGTEDGTTFTALAVDIELPHVQGVVTEKSGSSVTIKRRDGTSVVIHIGSDTNIKVRGKDTATVADITVGDRVGASGTQRSDGSIDAQEVRGRTPKVKGADKSQGSPAPAP
jgi:Domain of unknown function (DUF5666)